MFNIWADFTHHEHLLHQTIKYHYDLPSNEVGGCLEIVLDDGNVDSRSIELCIEQCKIKGDTLGGMICDILLNLDQEQREELYKIRWGR